MIDKKVNELSYGGIKDMEGYFRDRLGVGMFNNDEQRNLLACFNEIRNINLHNGSKINDLFLSKVAPIAGLKFVKGKIFHLEMDGFVRLATNALRVALLIDTSVASKFKLRRRCHERWS